MTEYIQNGVGIIIVFAIILCLLYGIIKLALFSASTLALLINRINNRVVGVKSNKIEIEDESDNQDILMIEYKIEDQWGTKEDLIKRHALEDRMQDTLGKYSLGFCDGGSIGGGTMEVCCCVTDYEAAKKVVEQDLQGTEFDNYARIYNERA